MRKRSRFSICLVNENKEFYLLWTRPDWGINYPNLRWDLYGTGEVDKAIYKLSSSFLLSLEILISGARLNAFHPFLNPCCWSCKGDKICIFYYRSMPTSAALDVVARHLNLKFFEVHCWNIEPWILALHLTWDLTYWILYLISRCLLVGNFLGTWWMLVCVQYVVKKVLALVGNTFLFLQLPARDTCCN